MPLFAQDSGSAYCSHQEKMKKESSTIIMSGVYTSFYYSQSVGEVRVSSQEQCHEQVCRGYPSCQVILLHF